MRLPAGRRAGPGASCHAGRRRDLVGAAPARAAAMSGPAGILYVVATPLGNPTDLAPRAVEALRAAEVVFAEDTRTARKLLTGIGLDRPTHSCFDANEA